MEYENSGPNGTLKIVNDIFMHVHVFPRLLCLLQGVLTITRKSMMINS